MHAIKSISAKLFLVICLSMIGILPANAKGKPNNPGGGKPDNGGGESTSECPTEVLINSDVISVSESGGKFVKQRSQEGVLTEVDVDALKEAEISQYPAGCNSDNVDFDTTYYGINIRSDDIVILDRSEFNDFNLIFNDDFDNTNNLPDYSNSFNYRRWSSKYAFSIDAKINTIPGEDAHWNVNTTGRYPGEGVGVDNFYNNSSQIDYLDTVNSTGSVFNTTPNGIRIIAKRNPDPSRKINGGKKYISGLLSSHSNPDPDKEFTVGANGFEFRYGYAEMRAKLPEQGNGFRAAFWLYSDNAYYNQLIRGNPDFIPNNNRHEIDVMEYLPNSGDVNGYQPQAELFGGVNNDARNDDKKILTYDTIFHTYHFNNGVNRTPTDWTFNAEDRYKTRRATVFPTIDGPNTPPYSISTAAPDGFVTYGVLWQPDSIEWYVNDVLVHRVLEGGETIKGFQVDAPVFNKRMYMIANLAMGLGVFEGEEIDSALLDTDNKPAFEIDYIKVWQPSNIPGAAWCGYGYTGSKWCDGEIGLD